MFEIFNETDEKIEEIKEMRQVLEYAIEREKVENVNFNVILVNNPYIHKLNQVYRHVDRPTDVISFALEDTTDITYPEFRLLGDIYISIDQAKLQAREYGHSVKRELCFLCMHGFLHLLGYDHIKIEDEQLMFALQEEILNETGITK